MLTGLWWYFGTAVVLTVLTRAVVCLSYIDGEINRLGNICKLTKVSIVQLRPNSAFMDTWSNALRLSSY